MYGPPWKARVPGCPQRSFPGSWRAMADKRISTTPVATDAWPPYIELACKAFSNQDLLMRRWQVVDHSLWQEILRTLEAPLMLFARLQQEELLVEAGIADGGLAPWCPLDVRGHQPFAACTAEELVDRMVAVLAEGGPYGGLRPPTWSDRLRARVTGMEPNGHDYADLRAAARELLLRWHPDGGPTRASHCRGVWCAFFLDVAWDHTFLTVDEATRTIGLLMITDTD
jgi:hypothetical protein